MDIQDSATKLVDPETSEEKESDAEIIAWARRRGVVSFLFFFVMAALVAFVTWRAMG